MNLNELGAISSSNRGSNWGITDNTGSYNNQTLLKIPSGGYYTYFSYNGVLSKYDIDGNRIWQKIVGFAFDAQMVKLLSNGDILFSGYVDEFYDRAAYGRFNPESETFLWIKYFLIGLEIGSWSAMLAVDSNEVYAYIGFYRKINGGSPNTDPTYPTLSRFSLSDGSISWTREIVAPNGYRAYSSGLVADTSGNVYMSGTYAISANSEYRGFVVKINSSGTTQWQKMFTRTNTGAYTDYLWLDGMVMDNAGNIHLAGYYRYDTEPVFGTPAYYAKINQSGTLLNQGGILPNPVPSINFPSNTYAIVGLDTDSNNAAHIFLYGQGFDYSVSTAVSATLVKISNGNTLDYVTNMYVGRDFTSGFHGPQGLLIDKELDRMIVGTYLYTGGPETVTVSIPIDGSAFPYTIKPNIFYINAKNITPGQLVDPPITVSSGSLTIRSATESYVFETPATPTVTTNTSDRYIKRFH